MFRSLRLALLLASTVGLALLAVLAVGNRGAAAAGLLTLSPTSGSPDGDFTISGRGFPPRSTVIVY